MYEKCLVCPDIGDEFLSSLKLASLYSKRVEVFTPVSEDWKSPLDALAQLAILSETIGIKPADKNRYPIGYSNGMTAAELIRDFHDSYHSDLIMLRDENILTSLSDEFLQSLNNASDKKAESNSLERLSGFVEEMKTAKTKSGEEFRLFEYFEHQGIDLEDQEPCVFELIWNILQAAPQITQLAGLGLQFEADLAEIFDSVGDRQREMILGVYLVFLAAVQRFHGSTPFTQKSSLLNLYEKFCSIYSLKPQPPSISQALVQYTLPSADHLPLYEIVKMRSDFATEFEMFWAGVQSLRSKIDPSLTLEDQRRQIEEIYSNDVRPVVTRLTNQIRNRKKNLAKFLSKEVVPEFLKGGVTLTVMSVMGVDLATSAGLGGVMAFAFPFLNWLKENADSNITSTIESEQFAVLARIGQLAE